LTAFFASLFWEDWGLVGECETGPDWSVPVFFMFSAYINITTISTQAL
jgi:hypothetical protein